MAKSNLIAGMPGAHLRAIGNVTVRWSGIELWVEIIIDRLLKPLHDGALAALQVGLGMAAKLDIAQGLVETCVAHGKAREEILGLLGEVRALQSDRNLVTHGTWRATNSKAKSVGVHLGKQNVAGSRNENWTAEDLNQIARKMKAIEKRLLLWYVTRRIRRVRIAWFDRRLPPPPRNRGGAARGKKRVKPKPRPRSSRG